MLTIFGWAAFAGWLSVLAAPWQPHRTRERLEAMPDRSGALSEGPGAILEGPEAVSEGPEAASARPAAVRGHRSLADVTVLIPARNEAAVIAHTLTALTRQGPDLDIVVIDDESTDGTAALCRRFDSSAHAAEPGAQGEAPRSWPVGLRLVAGRPPRPGWSGKLWALEQGLAKVRRPRILLLDADIELAPGMIAALLEQSAATQSDLVSIMATLRSRAPAEKLLAPAFVFFFKLIYPFALASSARHRIAAAAGGCMLVTSEALRELGGFAPLRDALIDDCTLAAMLKGRGHRTWIGLSRSVKSLRAYTFADFWRMVSRTAFTQLRYSAVLLLAATAALVLMFAVPAAALAAPGPARIAGAAALGAMSLAYLPVVRFYRLPILWVLTLPLAALLMLAMTWHSALGYWRGVRARWKDRAYRVAD